MDALDLYELCVQSPRHMVGLLRAIHGGEPRVLAEDFCGSASVSREWIKREGCSAIAADIDPVPLARARDRCGSHSLRLERRDVIRDDSLPGPADVIFVGNFSIGEIHDRPTLVRYLRRSHDRLSPRGVFICDTYGGESAFRMGAVTRRHAAPDGAIVHYTWEQRRADPATGMVENALHFRVQRAGEIVLDLPDAFTYRWRLWSIPELRDAMAEAGFVATSVHQSLEDVASCAELPASYIVCVAARRG